MINVHPLPTANIAGDNEICLGGQTTLTATGGTSYLWSNGETTNWITVVSPSATTEYSVTVTDGKGCRATAAYTVTVHPLPTANIAGDNEICFGGHTTLTATPAAPHTYGAMATPQRTSRLAQVQRQNTA
ncbi:MAG: hypothetical protein U0T36_00080 [Saprospiraceae bacterium]